MVRKRVLLVSSDPRFFESRENTFQTRGCDVFTAMSGVEAQRFLVDHGADLVICHGAPDGVSAAAFREAVGNDQALIIVPVEGQDISEYKKAADVHVVESSADGKPLLKLSSKLLDIVDRKYLKILVQIRVTNPKPTTIFGKSRDVSSGGILVETKTSQTLAVHEQVTVSFLLPGADRMVQSTALVMREVIQPEGERRYGLKFLSLSAEDQAIVDAWVASGGPAS